MIEWVDKAEKLQQYIMISLFYSVAHNACLKASAAILVKIEYYRQRVLVHSTLHMTCLCGPVNGGGFRLSRE